ncbi:MAG: hypothetical protein L0Z62_08455, partial [Gemmataceae bacterium]|nr:hypothetical protein [Gemmataceae bacterium]
MKKAGTTVKPSRRPRAKAADRLARNGRPAVRYLYTFGGGRADGRADMKALLGGKGANLAEMARLELPVPPGFTITTDTCRAYFDAGRSVPESLWEDVRTHLAEVEAGVGRKFGDPANPLLVSVRSGSKFSMPGMMDTILN